MESWLVPLEVAAAVAFLAAMAALGLIMRRLALFRRRGTFDCSVRVPPKGWAIGMARYEISELHWYAFFSFRSGPSRVWTRRELMVREAASSSEAEAGGLSARPPVVVVPCRHGRESLDFGLAPDVATGFSSWLESAPPGLDY